MFATNLHLHEIYANVLHIFRLGRTFFQTIWRNTTTKETNINKVYFIVKHLRVRNACSFIRAQVQTSFHRRFNVS